MNAAALTDDELLWEIARAARGVECALSEPCRCWWDDRLADLNHEADVRAEFDDADRSALGRAAGLVTVVAVAAVVWWVIAWLVTR